jgi:hypothetical protein
MAATTNDLAVKRSVLRVIGLNFITNGIYHFYWFYVTRQRLTSLVNGKDQVGLQTVGLIVPILNAFILYWLYRDINKARAAQKLDQFPAGLYVWLPYALGVGAFVFGFGALMSLLFGVTSGFGSDASTGALAGAGISFVIFILLALAAGITALVFFCIAVSKLNQLEDVRSKGKAVNAKFGRGEIAVIVVGVILLILRLVGGGYSGSSGNSNNSLDNYNSSSSQFNY